MKDEKPQQSDDARLRLKSQQIGIKRAQQRAKRYLKPGTSLVDELLAERHGAVKE